MEILLECDLEKEIGAEMRIMKSVEGTSSSERIGRDQAPIRPPVWGPEDETS